jgi:hypothetical protein
MIKYVYLNKYIFSLDYFTLDIIYHKFFLAKVTNWNSTCVFYNTFYHNIIIKNNLFIFNNI